ncbi:hypothetical protein THAOC_12748 [Thalassiosira oceanica]|uniref:Uncharacterized protein n=1 Tax=Thalassiosira oceanica TaxID=159749 RepID=K0SLY7_THAOC|nr:hypothetical protein THAOC_12748 [Thalassiosira oceanica]|eukprot:EJK66340.1 hypothetical protein THAOC_12748 [Thalassiosira oceanica]
MTPVMSRPAPQRRAPGRTRRSPRRVIAVLPAVERPEDDDLESRGKIKGRVESPVWSRRGGRVRSGGGERSPVDETAMTGRNLRRGSSLRHRLDYPPGATGGTTAEAPPSSPSANGAAVSVVSGIAAPAPSLATRRSQESKGAKPGEARTERRFRGTQSSGRTIDWCHSSSNYRQLGRVSARTMRGIRGDDLARGTEAGPRAGTRRRIFPEVGASARNGGRRSEHVVVSARTWIRTTRTSLPDLSHASDCGRDNQLSEMGHERGPWHGGREKPSSEESNDQLRSVKRSPRLPSPSNFAGRMGGSREEYG